MYNSNVLNFLKNFYIKNMIKKKINFSIYIYIYIHILN